MFNVDDIKHDILHSKEFCRSPMHATKLGTAMKATRSALVGFLLSILAWQVRRCRSTSVDRAYIYIYLYIHYTYICTYRWTQHPRKEAGQITANHSISTPGRPFEPSSPTPGRPSRWWCSRLIPVEMLRYAERMLSKKGQRRASFWQSAKRLCCFCCLLTLLDFDFSTT